MSSGLPAQRPRRWWSSPRALLLVAAVVVGFAVVLAALALVFGRLLAAGPPLDPESPSRDGSRALARVLAAQGVEVEVARGHASLMDAERPGSGTTVVVTSAEELSEQTARRTLDRVRGAGRVVVVEPDPFLLRALGLPVHPAGSAPPRKTVVARCATGGLSEGDEISRGGQFYRATGRDARVCFRSGDGGSLVLLPASGSRPETVVLGAGHVLTNGVITRDDNAGVALRLLGGGDRVLWYVPSLLDAVEGEGGSAETVTPRPLWPLVSLGLVTVLAAMLWRGRRFGRLVVEPLPAVVKAIETTQSRGRLYHHAGDASWAGESLRSAATRRLAGHLGLPAGAPPSAVAGGAATAAGRSPEEVLALLAGTPARDEAELVSLADQLSTLEKETLHP
jgi:hypothetical protein